MEKGLENYRKIYEKESLLEKNLKDNPIELFRDWFLEAEADDNVSEANAMSIATIGKDGFPKTRVVLMKRFNENGFIFYTNYNSEKGLAIKANNKTCLSFFWPSLERQIIIKGNAVKLTESLSDGYFDMRPRGSQLGAWASQQSKVVSNREKLEEKLKEYEHKFENQAIPRPEYWGGFIVEPEEIEFWQGRPNRLHDRIRYKLDKYDWLIDRLAP